MVNVALQEKEDRRTKIATDLGSVLVAYSGGVYPTFLLKFAIDNLGPNKVAAVTAVMDSTSPKTWKAPPLWRRRSAPGISSSTRRRWMIRSTSPLRLIAATIVRRPLQRALDCEKSSASLMSWTAPNISDQGDYRPGERATKELGIRSPLREAGLDKTRSASCRERRASRTGTCRHRRVWPQGFPTVSR